MLNTFQKFTIDALKTEYQNLRLGDACTVTVNLKGGQQIVGRLTGVDKEFFKLEYNKVLVDVTEVASIRMDTRR